MTQDEFLMWLFEKFNMPESRYADLSRIYGKALPENTNFEILKNAVICEWKSTKTLPTTNWLSYRARPKKQAGEEFGAPCEAVKAILEAKAFRRKNFSACQEAKERVMDEVERLWGKRPGRRQGCF